MGARDETGGSIFLFKVVDHQDETDHRPAISVGRVVHVERLGRHVGTQRPTEEGAEFEGFADGLATGRQ